jgi:DNA-binding response OmpR family regulator
MSDGFNPDIVICDNDVREGDLVQLISAIRHGEVGSNPFVAIIAISWKATKDTVNDILGTGADFIMAAPFSPQQLLVRIRSLVHNRKKFVVTAQYVGPERRAPRDPEGGDRLPLIDAPNSLRAKAVGEWDPASFHESINVALSTLNGQKIAQHAQQLSVLAEQVALDFTLGGGEIDIQQLERLMVSAEDLLVRSTSGGLSHVAELAAAVKTVLTDLRRTESGRQPRQVELLRQLAYAVRTAVVASSRTASIVHDIASTVSRAGRGGPAGTRQANPDSRLSILATERTRSALSGVLPGRGPAMPRTQFGRAPTAI